MATAAPTACMDAPELRAALRPGARRRAHPVWAAVTDDHELMAAWQQTPWSGGVPPPALSHMDLMSAGPLLIDAGTHRWNWIGQLALDRHAEEFCVVVCWGKNMTFTQSA